MKTAEEIAKEVSQKFTGTGYSNTVIIEAMKVYAKEVADQALKDAAENAELEEIPSRYPYGISDWKVDKQSITNTPIITP